MPSLLWVNQFALLPGDGGGTRHFELGRELVKKGWQVTILAADLHLHARRYTRRRDAADRSAQIEIKDGVEVRWLWAASYERNDWQRVWNWLTFHRSVLREGRRLPRPDVVIGSSPQLLAAWAAMQLAQGVRAPFVFEVRDLWPESLLAVGGRRGIGYHVLDRVARSLYTHSDRVLVLARGSQHYLKERGVPSHKLVLIPNGVDVGLVTPQHRAPQPAGAETFTAIYAGAHGPANGLECVLDAAEILGPASNIGFLLVGDGPAKPALREQVQRRGLTNVELLEPVSKPALVELLQRADAGLMLLKEAPLFSFGVSPNKLFDYFAAGLPVVCNVRGEVADMLQGAGAGVQTRDSSGAALAQSVRELAATDAAARRRMGLSGRAWVEREHSREALGLRLDTFLRGLLQR